MAEGYIRKAEMTLSKKISIPSELKQVKAVSLKVMDILRPYSLSAGELLDIRLCLEEALVNSIKYGNKLNSNLPVDISYGIEKGILKITLSDRGEGFDHKNVPDPTVEENLQELKGRGVYLIRRLMDEVSFNERGSEITMIKKIEKGD